ncbi:MAG TPA: aldose epimerase family protein [Caulobacteraceae bacterium]|nr:aldose epimerase family protein [Caulobacteraceae bacterium]
MGKALIGGLLAAAAWWNGAAAAEVKAAPYGVTKDGKAVTAYTLINDSGASATVLDFGGAIAAIRVPDRHGVLGNVVLSFQGLSGWEALAHANSLIGRYANRIFHGFTLDGAHYDLTQNAQGVTLHGGPPPYASRILAVDPVRKADGAAVTMRLDSPDGDQGFPGHVRVAVTYRFTDKNALRLDFVATTDKPTVINLTNHIYFNLNGNGTTPIYSHDLQIRAERYSPKGPDGGQLDPAPVAGTPYDFRQPVVLGDRVAGALDPALATGGPGAPATPPGTVRGYDNSMILDDPGRLDHVAARLHDPVSGRILELRTTETSLQLFTPAAERANLLSEDGRPFVRAPAVALETQHLPDSPNHPSFPSTVLRPGQTFRSTTIFAFSTDAKP